MKDLSHPTFLEITHLSLDYWQAVELRQQLLREPLGRTLTVAEVLAETPPQRHFVVKLASRVIGCASVVPCESHVILRQVAIVPALQGSGLGTRLMQWIESALLSSAPPTLLQLHARATARAFYEKLGYRVVGEAFEEVGLTHFLMVK